VAQVIPQQRLRARLHTDVPFGIAQMVGERLTRDCEVVVAEVFHQEVSHFLEGEVKAPLEGLLLHRFVLARSELGRHTRVLLLHALERRVFIVQCIDRRQQILGDVFAVAASLRAQRSRTFLTAARQR